MEGFNSYCILRFLKLIFNFALLSKVPGQDGRAGLLVPERVVIAPRPEAEHALTTLFHCVPGMLLKWMSVSPNVYCHRVMVNYFFLKELIEIDR